MVPSPLGGMATKSFIPFFPIFKHVPSPLGGMATMHGDTSFLGFYTVPSPLGGMATYEHPFVFIPAPGSKPTVWDGDLSF